MEIKNDNGYLLATEESDCITLDNIKVFEPRKGTGRILLDQLKSYAYGVGKNIELYAYPQDDTINEDDLCEFYNSCGFELDKDDTDGKMFVYEV